MSRVTEAMLDGWESRSDRMLPDEIYAALALALDALPLHGRRFLLAPPDLEAVLSRLAKLLARPDRFQQIPKQLAARIVELLGSSFERPRDVVPEGEALYGIETASRRVSMPSLTTTHRSRSTSAAGSSA